MVVPHVGAPPSLVAGLADDLGQQSEIGNGPRV
jgi:hypothetical protein